MITGRSSGNAGGSYTAKPGEPVQQQRAARGLAPKARPPAERPLSHRRQSGFQASLWTAALLALAACGGGDGSAQGDGETGTRPPSTLQDLTGEWVQKGCVRTGGQSFKRLIRATLVQARSLEYAVGVLSFNGSDCTGPAQRAGPSLQGTVTFNRSEGNASLVAHWGELATVTGQRSGAIWTLQANGLLCLLGDGIPSIQTSLGQVAASVATIPADNCFQRRTP